MITERARLRTRSRSSDISADALLSRERLFDNTGNACTPSAYRRHSRIALAAAAIIAPLVIMINELNKVSKIQARKELSAQAERAAKLCIEKPADKCGDVNESLLSIDTKNKLNTSRLNFRYQIEKKAAHGSLSKEEAGDINALYGPCKQFVGDVMGRDPKTMRSDYSDRNSGVVGISYTRDSDFSEWKYECRTEGPYIYWRTVDSLGPESGSGRWRNEDRRPISQYRS